MRLLLWRVIGGGLMKSKNEILNQFQNILTLLVIISRIWKDIRGPIGDILEKYIDTLDEDTLVTILTICEQLDDLLFTMQNHSKIMKN